MAARNIIYGSKWYDRIRAAFGMDPTKEQLRFEMEDLYLDDNIGINFGDDNDAEIAFTGTNLVITSPAGGVTAVTGAATVNGNATVRDVLTFNDYLVHGAQKTQTKATAYTMTLADSGIVTYVSATAVITLPATVVGVFFILVNAGADGAAQISVDPAAADKIQGAGLTSADNKDVINTLATAKKGDMISLIGDGADGWFITEMRGVWAREA